jgi:2-amino-4-hydroxy-6-hydroxymethyldihydropteridine diphosphokinase
MERLGGVSGNESGLDPLGTAIVTRCVMAPNVSPRAPTPTQSAAALNTPLHPVVAKAARGELPEWAVARPVRREHMARVAGLLDTWATTLSLGQDDRMRWCAAGYLHDALRDERPDTLRTQVPAERRDLPDAVLHGPAAAARLRQDGVRDEELLAAVACHTTGGAGLGALGRALYVADYLEPGRSYGTESHARLRDRMPGDLNEVLREVVAERIRRSRESGRPLARETLAFWSELEGEPR